MSKFRSNQPGAANKPRHDVSSADRLAWARGQWRENFKIPINGDGGMIRRMKEVFGLAASYEVLAEIRDGVRRENEAAKRATPPADKPPATNGKSNGLHAVPAPTEPAPVEVSLRKARAERQRLSAERKEWARLKFIENPSFSVEDMAALMRGTFGQATNRRDLVRFRKAAQHAAATSPTPKPKPVERKPAPKAEKKPEPKPAEKPRDEATDMRALAQMLLDEFPTLARFELSRDESGKVALSWEMRRAGSTTLDDDGGN